ncbi:hypothetical protein D3C76_1616210 [compost metagenome]
MATPPYTPHGSEFYLNEFFVLRSFRGKGVAEAAAVEVFNRHSGTWELQTNPESTNIRAQTFWRKTIKYYTDGVYEEKTADTMNDGTKLVLSFSNELKRRDIYAN